MPPFDREGLSQLRRACIEAALVADPALASELELIVGLLAPAVRDRFWEAFADALAGLARPAAAVLAALEQAALGGDAQTS